MLNIDFIKKYLGESLISGNNTGCYEKVTDIELLDKQDKLIPGLVYIGTQKKVEDILNSDIKIENGTLIFSTEAGAFSKKAITNGNCFEVIETSLSFAECYNLVNGVLRKWRSWHKDTFLMQYENNSPQKYLEYISAETGASVFLFDMQGYVLAEANKFSTSVPMIKKIMKEGRLSKGQMQLLETESISYGSFRKLQSPEFGVAFYFRIIPLSKEESAIIMLTGDSLIEDVDLDTLMHCFAEPIAASIKSVREIGLSEDDLRFKRLWDSIMEKQFNGAAEIREKLSSLSVSPLLFARVLVIDFKRSTVPANIMLSELHVLFPHAHIAAGEQEFVLILYHSERPSTAEIENNIPLRALLEKYDAYLSFSCAARDLTALPNQYRIAKQIITLAKQIDIEPGERIYRHERYSVYCIIDYFAQNYYSVHGNNDIILLIHPAVVHLTRYDQIHNNNLRDIFHEYLLSDCSVAKTAAKTYMHRNTIMNKLKKITDMIDINLESGVVCQQLLFSCQVILYYERVLGLRISP